MGNGEWGIGNGESGNGNRKAALSAARAFLERSQLPENRGIPVNHMAPALTHSLFPTPYSPFSIPGLSNLHLRAQLDQTIAGNLEERCGRGCIAGKEFEQAIAP